MKIQKDLENSFCFHNERKIFIGDKLLKCSALPIAYVLLGLCVCVSEFKKVGFSWLGETT